MAETLSRPISASSSSISHHFARDTFISQLLTAGIPKEWIIRQVGHTSTRMIDEHYGKWISEDAAGMAAFVSEKLGVSEGLVPKWSHTEEGRDLIPMKSTLYMAESESDIADTLGPCKYSGF
jgi:integrase